MSQPFFLTTRERKMQAAAICREVHGADGKMKSLPFLWANTSNCPINAPLAEISVNLLKNCWAQLIFVKMLLSNF